MNAAQPVMLDLTREAARGVEYSVDPAASGSAFMVGFPHASGQFERVARHVSFAAEWAWMLDRFIANVAPLRYLLRADVDTTHQVSALTAYCRLPFFPKSAQFQRWLDAAWPWRWNGTDVEAISGALGVEGPAGVAFRVSLNGGHAVATYFDLSSERKADLNLSKIFDMLGWSVDGRDALDALTATLKRLYAAGPRGVVGFDGGAASGTSALKFNPPNVPLERAWEFFAAHGAPAAGISRVRTLGQALRARWMTYLGVKVSRDAKITGRAYYSVRPAWIPGPLAPLLVSEREAVPAYRLPHY